MEAPGEGDAELVQRLIGGDQTALATLYDRHAGVVYRTAFRLLGDRESAEEVVQETMLTLWDRAEVYDPGVASLGAWLGAITRNRAIDRLRMRGRRIASMPLTVVRGAQSVDAEADDRVMERGALIGAGERTLEPEAAGEAAWVRDRIAHAVATLPEVERRVIELAYSDELSQSEIATRLGWPLGTVKTRTRRALAMLRNALADVKGGEPDDSESGRTAAATEAVGFRGSPFATTLDRRDCAPC